MSKQLKINDDVPEKALLQNEEKKLHELCAARSKEVAALEAATQRAMKQVNVEKEAEALLKGSEISPIVAQKTIEEIEHKIVVLDRAIDRQRQAVSKARSAFSLSICEVNKPEYIEIERRIAKCVQELAHANEAEARFFKAIEDTGASPRFRPMRLMEIGFADDPNGRLARHMRELQQHIPELS
jgi:hypothetical protein